LLKSIFEFFKGGAPPPVHVEGDPETIIDHGRRYWFIDIEKRGQNIEEIALLLGKKDKPFAIFWKKSDGIGAADLFEKLLKNDDVLIGHNICAFDIPELASIYQPIRDLVAIDTLPLSRFLKPFQSSHRLFDLLSVYQVEPSKYESLSRHTALDDVKANSIVMSAMAGHIRTLDPISLGLLKGTMPKRAFEALTAYCDLGDDDIPPARYPDAAFYSDLWKMKKDRTHATFRTQYSVDEEIKERLLNEGASVFETNDISQYGKALSTAIFTGRDGFILMENTAQFEDLSQEVNGLEWVAPWSVPQKESWCLKTLTELVRDSDPDTWDMLPYMGVIRKVPYPNGIRVQLFKGASLSNEAELLPIKNNISKLVAPKEEECAHCQYRPFCGKIVPADRPFAFLSTTPENILSFDRPETVACDTILWLGFHPLSDNIGIDPSLSQRYPGLADKYEERLMQNLTTLTQQNFPDIQGNSWELELGLFREKFKESYLEHIHNSNESEHPFWHRLLKSPLEEWRSAWVRISLEPFSIEVRSTYNDVESWMHSFLKLCKNLMLCGMGLGINPSGKKDIVSFLFNLEVQNDHYVRRIKKKGRLTIYGREILPPPGQLNPENRLRALLVWIQSQAKNEQAQFVVRDCKARNRLSDFLRAFSSDRAVILIPENRQNWPKELERINRSSLVLTHRRVEHPGIESLQLWIERVPYMSPQSFPWGPRINWLLQRALDEHHMSWIRKIVPLKAALDLVYKDIRVTHKKELDIHLLDPRVQFILDEAGDVLEGSFDITFEEDRSKVFTGKASLPQKQVIWIRDALGERKGLDKTEALEMLSRIWGFAGFKSYGSFDQWDVIQAVTAGEDFFMVVSTGGGKSVCFQIPSFHLQNTYPPPLTLVFSPLQALMQDQVKNLEKRGIFTATFINSLLSPVERKRRILGIKYGLYSLVYLAPEQLRNQNTVSAILQRDIGLLAIDEAHTLSQWGHNFRTDFFYIKPFMENNLLRGQDRPFPILAVTATAKAPSEQETEMANHTRQDIIKQLGLNVTTDKTFCVGTSRREELFFKVIDFSPPEDTDPSSEKWQDIDERKLDWIKRNLSNGQYGQKGIVYCAFANRTENLSKELKGHPKLEVRHYNGKMRPEAKNEAISWFRKEPDPNRIHVLTATNAFGMGIDVSDIGFIIHHDLPGTLEAYYQEAGRACRDQSKVKQGYCVLLYHPEDLRKQRFLSRSSQLRFREISRFYDCLVQRGDEHLIIPVEYLSAQAGLTEDQIKQALFYLEYRSLVERDGESVPFVRLKGVKTSTLLLKILANTSADPAFDILKEHLSSVISQDEGYLIEKGALRDLWGLDTFRDVARKLRELHDTKMICILPQSRLTFVKPLEECQRLLKDLYKPLWSFLATKGATMSVHTGQEIRITSKDLRALGIPVGLLNRLLLGICIADPNWLNKSSVKVGSSDVRFTINRYNQAALTRLTRTFQEKLLSWISPHIEPGEPYPLKSLDMYQLQNNGFFDLISVLEEHNMVKSKLGPDFAGRSLELQVSLQKRLDREDLDLEALYTKYTLDSGRLEVVKRYAEEVSVVAETDQNQIAQDFLAHYFDGKKEVIPPEVPSPYELEPEQVQAIQSVGPVHVEGTAGCGKSEIIVHKVNYLERQAVPIDSVVVTAHSFNSLQNLRDRYAKVFGRGNNLEITTVHSLGSEIIASCFQKLGFQRRPKIHKTKEELAWVREQLPQACQQFSGSNMAEILDLHEKEKKEGIIVEQLFATYWIDYLVQGQYKKIQQSASKMPLNPFVHWAELVTERPPYMKDGPKLSKPENWEDLIEIKKQLKELVPKDQKGIDVSETAFCSLCFRIWYENLLMKNNRVTFQDQIILALRALEHLPDLAHKMQSQYDHALIDEYQDLTPMQLKLLEYILGGANATILGDKNQAIYDFGENGDDVSDRIKDALLRNGRANRIDLKVTYRSTTQIISMAHKLIDINWRAEKLPISKKGDGEPVKIWIPDAMLDGPDTNPAKEEYFRAILAKIQSLTKTDPDGTILVTAYTKMELWNFMSFMRQQERLEAYIQVRIGSDPLKNLRYWEVGLWLRAIHCSTLENVLQLLSFSVTPYLTGEDLTELKVILSKDGCVDDWRKAIETWNNVKQRRKMAQILTYLSKVDAQREQLTVSVVLYDLVNNMVKGNIAKRQENLVKTLTDNHPHYITFGTDSLPDLENTTIHEWLKMIFGGNEEDGSENVNPKIVIGNIHQIKGEEYRYVFVCGFKAPAEQKHLYVGMTRAEREAYLCFLAPEMTKKALDLHGCVEGSDYALRVITTQHVTRNA